MGGWPLRLVCSFRTLGAIQSGRILYSNSTRACIATAACANSSFVHHMQAPAGQKWPAIIYLQ
jgi:hypothetical protein